MPPPADLTVRDGLRLFTPAAALVRVPESFFARNPIETQVVLASLRDASDLLARLLDGGHSVVAGRSGGSVPRIGRAPSADEIVTTMKAAGYDVRESDPFAGRALDPRTAAAAPPIVGRIQAMWESMRARVLDVFPPPPGLPRDTRRLPALRRRHLSERCLSFALHRRLQRLRRADRTRARGKLGPRPSRRRPPEP